MTQHQAFHLRTAPGQRSTRFVGRDAELEQLRTWAPGVSFVTGPPGVGKTRLLREFTRTYAGTALTLDLDQWEPSQWMRALGSALTLPAQGPTITLERVEAALSTLQDPLLILDHAEFLPKDGLDALYELCWALPQLRVSLSARRLDAAPSQTLKLGPLSLQGGAASEATRMLRELALPTLGVDPAHDAELTQIATLLDGLPLGLELVAARLDILSPSQLLARLEQDTSPSMSKHLTWAWSMLAPDEQDALERASICQESFSPSAFEALLEHPDPLDVLARLLQASMLVKEHENAEFRYRLLRPIRDFARSRRADPGDLHPRHAAHFAGLCHRQYWERAKTRPWSQHITALLPDHANLTAALRWSVEHRPEHEDTLWLLVGATLTSWHRGILSGVHVDADTLLQHQPPGSRAHAAVLISTSDLSSVHADRHDKHRDVLHPIVHHPDRWDEETNIHAKTRHFERLIDDYSAPHKLALEEHLALVRARGLTSYEARLLLCQSHAIIFQGDHARAIATSIEAEELCDPQDVADQRIRARALIFRGFAYAFTSQHHLAPTCYQEALEIFAAQEDIASQARTLDLLSDYHLSQQQWESTTSTLQQLLRLGERYAIMWAHGVAHFRLSQVLMECEKYEEALVESGRALIHLERVNNLPLMTGAFLLEVHCNLLLGDQEKADARVDDACEAGKDMHSAFGRIQLDCIEASRHTRHDRLKEAEECLERAKSHIQESEDFYLKHLILLHSCNITLARYLDAFERGKKRKSKALLSKLMEDISLILRTNEDQGTSPYLKGTEIRIALRVLKNKLPETFQQRLDVELQDPGGVKLLLDEATQSFRTPGASTWEDLSSRDTPFRLLLHLARHQDTNPGAPLLAEELCDLVWPDEIIMADAANNRLYVTISTVRRLGMGDLIESHNGGYRLHPEVEILWV